MNARVSIQARCAAAGLALVCMLAFIASVLSMECVDGCHVHGTCNEEIGRCDCPRHRAGSACDLDLALKALSERCSQLGYPGVESCTSNSNRCLNGCNARGICVAGFCHCWKGFFGMDCSLSLGTDGKAQVLADRGYRPRSRGPRVYMYELPPSMTAWRNELRLDRPTTQFFIERLTATGVRVGDGDTADWYFIPVTLRHSSDAYVLAKAVSYIQDMYPWWNRTQGHRHFVIATGDMGRIESERGPLTANVTFVTHWGLYAPKPTSGWLASHRNATDIVLPVFLGANKLSRLGVFTSRNHPKFATKAQPELLPRNGPTFFFAGRICGDHSRPRLDGVWPHCETSRSKGYSGGTRQRVHFHHWNRSGFFIQLGDRDYAEHLLTSKYCFGPMGGGHGQRQMQAVLAGCVPVLISDDVLEAFEPYLDWNTFGVRLAEADISRLHEVLAAIRPEEYERKVELLRCAAQHMAFSTITGATQGESGKFDAFETTLEILRAKAAHPDAAPGQLRQLDPQFDAFMDCRDPDQPYPATSGSETHSSLSSSPSPSLVAAMDESSNDVAADADAIDSHSSSPWRQQQPWQRASSTATSGSRDSDSGSNSDSSRRLCSVSYFDVDDPDTPTCRSLSFKNRGPLYGGLMCIRQPMELAHCPRPWS
ncbi:hypothetical protein Vafri_1495 [Volvox africanus]|nr:hypothetical protein Vafri_1495 [Volvox africanus]